MKKMLMVVCLMMVALCAWAYENHVNGTVNLPTGKTVSIVVEYDNYGEDMVGRYAYKSTIKKYGKKKSSYLYFYPDGEGNWVVKDHQGNVVEYWSGYFGPCRLTAGNNSVEVNTTQGKSFNILFP